MKHNICVDCKAVVSSNAKRCNSCAAKLRRAPANPWGRPRKHNFDKEKLTYLYNIGISPIELGKIQGVHANVVRYWLRKFGVKLRNWQEAQDNYEPGISPQMRLTIHQSIDELTAAGGPPAGRPDAQ